MRHDIHDTIEYAQRSKIGLGLARTELRKRTHARPGGHLARVAEEDADSGPTTGRPVATGPPSELGQGHPAQKKTREPQAPTHQPERMVTRSRAPAFDQADLCRKRDQPMSLAKAFKRRRGGGPATGPPAISSSSCAW